MNIDKAPNQEQVRKKTVTILIENNHGDILLMLRDNDPAIPYPNQWYIPGGGIEGDESADEAMSRELREEFGDQAVNSFEHFMNYEWTDKDEAVFITKSNVDTDQLNAKLASGELSEGQEFRYFSRAEIAKMDLAFHDNEIIADYINESYESD